MPEAVLAFAAAVVAGYLLGSIPSGLLLMRVAGKGDIRSVGSGNIGATNVLRSGSKALAALTLLLDGGKGALAAAVAQYLGGDVAGALAGLAAVLGHDFPVWLGFRGGKGVATTFGVLLAVAAPSGLAAVATWLLVAVLWRYSSLAALVALALAPLYALAFAVPYPAPLLAAALALLGIVRHAGNIRRLLDGVEPRIGATAGRSP